MTLHAKQSLRSNMKHIINSLSDFSIMEQSTIIQNKLTALKWYKNSTKVGVYLSMKNEVQTDGIVEHILHSGKQCFIPWYNKDVMKMVRIDSINDLDSLPMTKWNIRQPADISGREEAVSIGGLDLLLVPGLAFTVDGKRLGRGKGYYDKFLAEMASVNPAMVKTIGLAFKEQILPEIPCAEHDFILDMVLFPDSTIMN